MKLFSLFAFVFVLVGSASSQQVFEAQVTENPSPCPKFSMPIIAPAGDGVKNSSFIKPDAAIDYKLIIVDPCTVQTPQQTNPSVDQTPLSENGKLFLPAPAKPKK